MANSFNNLSTYSRFNLSESMSDIHIFVQEYRDRIKKQLAIDEYGTKNDFVSFASKRLSLTDVTWLQDNTDRFLADTANENLAKVDFLSSFGFIFCTVFSPDGTYLIAGHSSGLIQVRGNLDGIALIMCDVNIQHIIDEYKKEVHNIYQSDHSPILWYPMFYSGQLKNQEDRSWIQENYHRFLKDSPNEISYIRWFSSEMGYITAAQYSTNGAIIIVGHSSGLIQMRHGATGAVLCTLRNIQFPPKPIYALEFSKTEERICFASCMDGNVYRIEIPALNTSVDDPPEYCIRADPALHSLHMQFYGAPGLASYATPFIQQRYAALSLGLTADDSKMAVGYSDTSIKLYDMETQEADITYKVHKLRLQFIPKKLQRMHFGQVCALRCHPQKPNIFASASWDNTLRIWDIRCKVGCVMTFEGVNVCGDSIDLNRDHCIAGSWSATEALSLWDLKNRKRLNIVRVQNRRADVDGEYIYACRYWHSTDFNRKGKYAIIGGSGTKCVEVINLHNRYITCSYPASGTVLAVTSFQDRIAFGGTATNFNIVKFHDPKHEKDMYNMNEEPEFDYSKAVSIFDGGDDDSASMTTVGDDVMKKSTISGVASKPSKLA